MPRSNQLQNATRVNVFLEKDEYEAYKAESHYLGVPFNAWVRMSLRQVAGWHPTPRQTTPNAESVV
jgi:predicted DNA binding CopG/RHH family protein